MTLEVVNTLTNHLRIVNLPLHIVSLRHIVTLPQILIIVEEGKRKVNVEVVIIVVVVEVD